MKRNLKSFISTSQVRIIANNIDGEEGDYFDSVVKELSDTINTMPSTYETDGQGDEAIAYLHYFKGACDWYITEKDIEAEQLQAFGLANLGYGFELGYICIQELIDNDIELDFHFTPQALKEVRGIK